MSRLSGTIMETCQDIPAPHQLQLFTAMGELLASLHMWPLASTHALRRARPVEDTYRAYREEVLHAHRPEHTLLQQAAEQMQRLATSLPPATTVCLVHRDFSQRNLLVTPTGAQWAIMGLTDFEKGCLGDLMEDLAMVVFKECVEQPPRKHAFLEAYRLTKPLAACASERLSYHLYGLLFEIAL